MALARNFMYSDLHMRHFIKGEPRGNGGVKAHVLFVWRQKSLTGRRGRCRGGGCLSAFVHLWLAPSCPAPSLSGDPGRRFPTVSLPSSVHGSSDWRFFPVFQCTSTGHWLPSTTMDHLPGSGHMAKPEAQLLVLSWTLVPHLPS